MFAIIINNARISLNLAYYVMDLLALKTQNVFQIFAIIMMIKMYAQRRNAPTLLNLDKLVIV